MQQSIKYSACDNSFLFGISYLNLPDRMVWKEKPIYAVKKHPTSFNQQQTASGEYVVANRGKINYVKGRQGLTELVIESVSLLK